MLAELMLIVEYGSDFKKRYLSILELLAGTVPT